MGWGWGWGWGWGKDYTTYALLRLHASEQLSGEVQKLAW